MTYTYAILEVPGAVYAAVRALLDRAYYQHAFHKDKDGEVIDMHGIALRSKGGSTDTNITVGTLLSSRTKQGRIDFTLNGELTQMDLDKAREVVGMLQGAIEAAISDELMYRFLTEKIGLEPDRASAALIDFRELRQGSREIAMVGDYRQIHGEIEKAQLAQTKAEAATARLVAALQQLNRQFGEVLPEGVYGALDHFTVRVDRCDTWVKWADVAAILPRGEHE